MTIKPHRIRVRTLDGKPRDTQAINQLKSNQLKMPHLQFYKTDVQNELIIGADKSEQIEQVRAKLASVGLEEISGGDTRVREQPAASSAWQIGQQGSGRSPQRPPQKTSAGTPTDLKCKPYAFVSLPDQFTAKPPVWHDGSSSQGRLSGKIRFELKTLTPLLVGWERGQAGDTESEWPVPQKLDRVGELAAKKSVLCPLRAPWGARPVIIPGDTLKGLLRHELGALLGAPMERVAERSYSYRPNAMFPNQPRPRLVPRLARVPEDGIEMLPLERGSQIQVRVPKKLELFPTNLQYDKLGRLKTNYYRFSNHGGNPYRGGLGAGQQLNSKRRVYTRIIVNANQPLQSVLVPNAAKQGYLATLRHLTDLSHGHFSERHPDVPNVVKGDKARDRILQAAQHEVFQPDDLIWVEWDTKKECIVSFGWHYYYRWAYVDTVRRKDVGGQNAERHGLFPLPEERAADAEDAPSALSAVRRLFGYTGDNEGSAGIGRDDYEQLMGRISTNAALEVVAEGESDKQRFLPPIFLKELGMPRPSAVEFYLKQPYHPNSRPSDRATLFTYGDAAGYDAPGELAGRKFYLDRADAYTDEPWKDDSAANRANERSTLALEASERGRTFRFTLRFRDLDPCELAAVLVALCPNQFHDILGDAHADGYCSKLGYARPLGWGSVRIEARALLFLQSTEDGAALQPKPDLHEWVMQHYQPTATQADWLAIHRCKHPDAGDYTRDAKGNIHGFHTKLRGEHSRLRRYPR